MNELHSRRLLVITPLPPPVGGIQTWWSVVSEELRADASVEVRVVDTGVRWRSPNNLRLATRLGGGSIQALRDFVRVLKQMRAFGPDAIHLNTAASLANPKDWLILQAARRSGVRSVVHYHVGCLPALARAGNAQWRLIRANMRLASTVVVLGRDTLESVASSVPGVKVVAIPNPIRDRKPAALPATGLNEAVRILFLGHVIEGKGVVELVSACRLMETKPFHLSIVGHVEENMRLRLTQLAGPEASRWLAITGVWPHEDCLREIDSADMIVLPSTGLFEAFPYAVLEAMRAARAVVATNRGAITEMLAWNTGEPCGIVVPPSNVGALHAALARLFDDLDERRILGERGRKRVLYHYLAGKIVARLKEVWFSGAAPEFVTLK